MNFRRDVSQRMILIAIAGCLCIYYVYQYFKIESLMDDLDLQYENAVRFKEATDKKFDPKPLTSLGDRHLLFQPNEEIEFPTVKFGKPKIPHIIHNVYKNYTIPYSFDHNVETFYVQNPDWEFRYWTFQSGRELIKNYHPYLLELFDSLHDNDIDNENKYNMIRYVVLYEYGGVTADFDVYNRRPLDIATIKYSCINPTEPFEHSALLFDFEVILSASIILCRPKHPFFKDVLRGMNRTDDQISAFDLTGGGHLTQMFMKYNNLTVTDLRKRKTDDSSNSPFFYKGQLAEDDNDAVYIPNSQYFMGDINHQLLNKKEDYDYPKEEYARKVDPKPLLSSADKHLLFQSNVEIEFPTVRFGSSKIPHIIHMVYINTTIPFGFVQAVRSFYVQHRNWKFRFWSFETGRDLIKKFHPYLLKTFDSWQDNAADNEKKSNMIRHVVLYEYGGFSADIDVDSVRPLDIATKKFNCIIPTEPFEHCAILHNFEVILSPSIMLCRPKHGFFKKLLNSMTEIDGKESAADTTGSAQLTRVYLEYNNLTMADLQKRKTDNSSNSPFFYKGERMEADDDAIYVPNSQYFIDNVNPGLLNKHGELEACSKRDILHDYLTTRACAEFASRKELREKSKYLFTFRYWYTIWDKHYTRRAIDIKTIIPKVIFYK